MEKQQALNKLRSLGYLSAACCRQFLDSAVLIRKDSGQFITRPGREADKLWFIIQGLVKAYYLNKNNRERIIHFTKEDEFLFDSYLFFHEKKYPYYIQCLEDCVLVEINFSAVKELMQTYPEYCLLNGKICGLVNKKAVIRSKILNKQEGTFKYQAFLKYHPYHHRISREDLCQYLNLSKSRLRHIIHESK